VVVMNNGMAEHAFLLEKVRLRLISTDSCHRTASFRTCPIRKRGIGIRMSRIVQSTLMTPPGIERVMEAAMSASLRIPQRIVRLHRQRKH
jgi:hypothetical protein